MYIINITWIIPVSLSLDISVQSSVAHTIHAMSRYSPDTAKNITVDLAPLVFLAMHGTVNEDGIL